MRCARIIQNCMLSCETIFTRIRWSFLQRDNLVTRPSWLFVVRASCLHALTGWEACSTDQAGCLSYDVTALQLLRLRDDSNVWLGRFPALRIPFLRLVVGDRAGDDNVLSRQPVD